MNSIIVGMGEVLWDVLPDNRQIGGAPANFAYHISQFGLDSRVVSAVGNDKDGDDILQVLAQKALHTHIARVPFPTGTVQVSLDKNGIPGYDIKQGVAWDNIPFTDLLESLAQKTSAVCFGSLAQRHEASRTTILKFLDAMPDGKGQLKIFDINLRQNFYTPDILRESLCRCNILKINDEELLTIGRLFSYPNDSPEKLCRRIMTTYTLEMIILTCGTNGSYVFTTNETSFQETPKVKVADTVGAGDSFTAAFTAALLKGQPVVQAHKIAVDVSAYVCTQNGAMPVLPTELRQRTD